MWSILLISLAAASQAMDVQTYRGKAWIQWAAEAAQKKQEAIEAMERLLVFPSAEVRAKAAEALNRLGVSDDHKA